MAIKGHRKSKEQKHMAPWPRHEILKHTEGKCPYCSKHCMNLELHVRAKHYSEEKKPLRGVVHGHD